MENYLQAYYEAEKPKSSLAVQMKVTKAGLRWCGKAKGVILTGGVAIDMWYRDKLKKSFYPPDKLFDIDIMMVVDHIDENIKKLDKELERLHKKDNGNKISANSPIKFYIDMPDVIEAGRKILMGGNRDEEYKYQKSPEEEEIIRSRLYILGGKDNPIPGSRGRIFVGDYIRIDTLLISRETYSKMSIEKVTLNNYYEIGGKYTFEISSMKRSMQRYFLIIGARRLFQNSYRMRKNLKYLKKMISDLKEGNYLPNYSITSDWRSAVAKFERENKFSLPKNCYYSGPTVYKILGKESLNGDPIYIVCFEKVYNTLMEILSGEIYESYEVERHWEDGFIPTEFHLIPTNDEKYKSIPELILIDGGVKCGNIIGKKIQSPFEALAMVFKTDYVYELAYMLSNNAESRKLYHLLLEEKPIGNCVYSTYLIKSGIYFNVFPPDYLTIEEYVHALVEKIVGQVIS